MHGRKLGLCPKTPLGAARPDPPDLVHRVGHRIDSRAGLGARAPSGVLGQRPKPASQRSFWKP